MEKVLGGAGPFRQRLFAWGFARFARHADEYMRPYKLRLFGDISGSVLEIGPGTGANLSYLKSLPVAWTGVEPNPFMHPYLKNQAAALGLPADLRQGVAERLPAGDGTIDAVISTLVLCSVTDPAKVLREVLRVLKPGGRFIFIEHVAAARGSGLRRIQGWLRPLWKRMGDGCHPDRELGRSIQEAGFESVSMEAFDAPVPVVKPHIAGVAVKRTA